MPKCKRCGKRGIFLKVNPEGICEVCEVEERYSKIFSDITPEQKECVDIRKQLVDLQEEREKEIHNLAAIKNQISSCEQILSEKEKLIIQKDEEILVQEFGLYQPKYDLVNSDAYKERLDNIRRDQKQMIKNNIAVTGNMNWTVNGSASQGKKMVKDMQKLLLRAFNAECDDLVEHIKYNNFESSLKRIYSSCESISKLGQIMSISVSPSYP